MRQTIAHTVYLAKLHGFSWGDTGDEARKHARTTIHQRPKTKTETPQLGTLTSRPMMQGWASYLLKLGSKCSCCNNVMCASLQIALRQVVS